MHVYIIYAHPSENSFTYKILNSFTFGLKDSGNTFEIGNLYKMGFSSEMDLKQYERETSFDPNLPAPKDVSTEHEKVQRADGLAFIYPVWWSDCPSILKGWFDKVWSLGYAYFYDETNQRKSTIKPKKALVICTAGHTVDHLEETGIAQSMKCIFIQDRLNNVGIANAKMEILGGTITGEEEIKQKHIKTAYELGRNFSKW